MATREQVLNAYRNNPLADPTPDEDAINYWMQAGLSNFDTIVQQVRAANPSLAASIDLERQSIDNSVSQKSNTDLNQTILQRLNNLTPANEFEGVSLIENGIEYFKDPTGNISVRPVGAKPTDTVAVFDSQGNLVNSYVEGDQRSWISDFNKIVGKTLPSVAATLALGPAGAGLLGGTGAAAAGSALGNLASGGNLESALKAAALGGLSAYGADQLLGSLGSLGDTGTALDLTIADDITQLASAGLNQNQIANIISTSYGVDPFTAASSVSSTLGTTTGTGGVTSAGTGGIAGQTVNVLGNTAGTGLGTAGTGLLGSVVGTGLTGTGAGTSAGNQTVNVTGTSTGTGTGTGSVIGSTIGSGLGTGTGTSTTSTNTNKDQTVNVLGSTLGGTTTSTIGGGVLGALSGTGLTGTGAGTGTQTVNVTGTNTVPTQTASTVGAVVPSLLTTEVIPKVEVVNKPIKNTCPSPEMLITLSDGTKKTAGELEVGDLVKTQHEHTLEWGVYPVVFKEIVPLAKRLKITFDGNEFIGSEDHKFFIAVDNWKKAKDLKPGDIVSGQTIKSIEEHTDGPVVFITIEDAHSYVCQDLLSHNKTPSEVVGSVVGSTVGTTGTTGTTNTTTTNNNLSLKDIISLLSLLGLGGTLGGTGTGTTTSTVGSIPFSDTKIGSTTPQFGNDYYAAVQQYYNAYMPETPRNVAGPLQQWYENKYGA